MRKQSVLAGALVCSLALAGCMLWGCNNNAATTTTEATTAEAPAQTGGTQLANPVHEGTLEEVAKATGIELKAPEGATDVTYSYIEFSEDTKPMAQVDFTLDGKKYCYRAQPTSKLTLLDSSDLQAAADGLAAAVEEAQGFTGVYGSFACLGNYELSGKQAIYAFNEGQTGFIQWIDAVPGIMYSLSIESGATQDLLVKTAETCFVPVQSNA